MDRQVCTGHLTPLAELKHEMEGAQMATEGSSAKTVQICRVHIRARAAAIWGTITKPERTNRRSYTGSADDDLRPGGGYRVTPNDDFKAQSEAMGLPCPDVTADGEVVEARARR